MVKASLMMVATVVVLGASPALAAAHHHRYHHRHHWRHHHHRGAHHHGPYTIGYGETIISGRTGFHRNEMNVMVPDSSTPSSVLSGRRRGSGIGANGLPGSNLDD